ncbi:MAG: hypothetical protein LUE08_07355 [Akkermansiaceae bacterium]|nr:hypothetical protein [Akkermansiaceae bacterium]
MNAMEHMKRRLEGESPEYLANLFEACSRSGGLLFFSPGLCYALARYDPVEGRHAETGCVLYIDGDASLLIDQERSVRQEGFTHLAWQRGLKPGTKRWKKTTIDNFKRLLLVSCRQTRKNC